MPECPGGGEGKRIGSEQREDVWERIKGRAEKWEGGDEKRKGEEWEKEKLNEKRRGMV